MIQHGFIWYDKVDKVYMTGSSMFSRSTRSVCRGFLQAFQDDKRMNPKEYELCHFCDFDDETGVLTPVSPIERVDPTIVFDKSEDRSHGDVEL